MVMISTANDRQGKARRTGQAAGSRYVLITAAHNEERHIARTIEAVVGQTTIPERWVIVSDHSTDATDDIVKSYASRHDFIRYARREADGGAAGFASKVLAVAHGYRLARELAFDFIGNLDADVSVAPDFFARLLREFQAAPGLGIGGGVVIDVDSSRARESNDFRYVSGPVQFFRRDCWEGIGGYVPVPAGGEDTIAVVMALMNGWRVEVFPSLEVRHHKDGKLMRGALRESFRDGAKDFALGSHPLFQVAKSVGRLPRRPVLLGATVRLAGFFWQYLLARPRPVDDEFVRFLRAEQWGRLKSRLHTLLSQPAGGGDRR